MELEEAGSDVLLGGREGVDLGCPRRRVLLASLRCQQRNLHSRMTQIFRNRRPSCWLTPVEGQRRQDEVSSSLVPDAQPQPDPRALLPSITIAPRKTSTHAKGGLPTQWNSPISGVAH